jgi:hypothetical protein
MNTDSAVQVFMQQWNDPLEGVIAEWRIEWRLTRDLLVIDFSKSPRTAKQIATHTNLELSPKRQKGPRDYDRCEGT